MRTSPYRAAIVALVAIPLLSPALKVILVELPVVSLTIGRLLIAVTAALVLVGWIRSGAPRHSPTRAAVVVAGLLAATWLWIVVNAVVWGCRCANEVAGFSEIAAVIGLALVVATVEPRSRGLLMVAAMAAGLVAAVAALAGVEGLSAGQANPAHVEGRLAGPYGNANFLAFLLALSVPSLLAYRAALAGRRRAAVGAALLVVATALVLTFSRSGLLAAAAGAAAVVLLAVPAAARRWAGLALAGAVLLAALLYPLFLESRREASIRPPDPVFKAIDTSGWDARQQGLIPGGPATLRNAGPEVLAVTASDAGEGASLGWGAAQEGERYRLALAARVPRGRLSVRIGLEDNQLANGPAWRRLTLTPSWRRLRLRWRPTGPSPDARLYIWSDREAGTFHVRDVVLAGPAGARTVATRLTGSEFAREQAARIEAKESRDLASRRAGVELALEAFADEPLRGIGWGSFPAFADARTDFGRLPTHNEYLRFLAELGVVGFILILGLVLAVSDAVRRGPKDALGLAVLGVLVSAGTGLLFTNALVASTVAMPLALAVAVACVRREPFAAETEFGPPWPERAAGGVPGAAAIRRAAAVVRRVGAAAAAWRSQRPRRPSVRLTARRRRAAGSDRREPAPLMSESAPAVPEADARGANGATDGERPDGLPASLRATVGGLRDAAPPLREPVSGGRIARFAARLSESGSLHSRRGEDGIRAEAGYDATDAPPVDEQD